MEWYANVAATDSERCVVTLSIFHCRLLAHSDEVESTLEPVVGESAPALAADAPIQDNVAGASSQSVSTTETAKSMKCDVYVDLEG